MCWCNRSDMKVNLRKKRKHYEPERINQLSVWHFWCILYLFTMLINVKICKTSVLRHSWGTILLCQLFGIMFWQILWVSWFLFAKDLFGSLNSSSFKYMNNIFYLLYFSTLWHWFCKSLKIYLRHGTTQNIHICTVMAKNETVCSRSERYLF